MFFNLVQGQKSQEEVPLSGKWAKYRIQCSGPGQQCCGSELVSLDPTLKQVLDKFLGVHHKTASRLLKHFRDF